MPDTLYISDSAYQHLVALAITSGYVKEHSKRRAGISLFLNKLSFSTFIDTRPEWAIKKHVEELSKERKPKWSQDIEPRMPRLVSLSNETLVNYTEASIVLKVHITRRLANGGKLVTNPIPIVSDFLEAVGIKWITPLNIPVATMEEVRARIQHVAPKRRSSPITQEITQTNPYSIYLRRGAARTKNTSTQSEYD